MPWIFLTRGGRAKIFKGVDEVLLSFFLIKVFSPGKQGIHHIWLRSLFLVRVRSSIKEHL